MLQTSPDTNFPLKSLQKYQKSVFHNEYAEKGTFWTSGLLARARGSRSATCENYQQPKYEGLDAHCTYSFVVEPFTQVDIVERTLGDSVSAVSAHCHLSCHFEESNQVTCCFYCTRIEFTHSPPEVEVWTSFGVVAIVPVESFVPDRALRWTPEVPVEWI